MLGDGLRCKVLGDNSFSAYWSDATTENTLYTILTIMKRKDGGMGEIVHSLGCGNFGHPCELHSMLRTNAYNWTFPNCNISFIMDQSTNKTTNEWLLQVAFGKTCPTLGALLFAWQQNHSLGCTKGKDRQTVGKSCLFWCSVFATICPLKILPIFVVLMKSF